MEKWKTLLASTALAGSGLIGVGVADADAQTAALPGGVVAVQQSAARADAAAFVTAMAGGSASCSASNATTTNLTVTITPPAGNFVYLTRWDVQVLPATTTGAASAQSWTATNIVGAPTGGWLAGETGGLGQPVTQINEVYPTALKAAAAGVAVVFAPNATVASAVECAHASGYFSPL